MTPASIWNEKQNKPTLIARDVQALTGLPHNETYTILLRRGVFKWLSVRRHLIKLKNTWKSRITWSLQTHDRPKEWLRGYHFALEQCRKEVRTLCHSPRWQAPDNDSLASRWLGEYSEVCPNCGGELETIHCKRYCAECGILVENCNGD